MQVNYEIANPVKIKLDKKTYQTLVDDALFFGYPSHHQLGKKVIFDSFETFHKDYKLKKDTLFKKLRNVIYDDEKTTIVVNESLKFLLNSLDVTKQSNATESISLRFNNSDQGQLLKLQDYYKHSDLYNIVSMSQYLRTFLYQYARLSRIERELLIFKDQYESIKKILKKNIQINIHTKDNRIVAIKPYQFIYFGDECHFLVGDQVETSKTFSIKLSNILGISHDDNITFDEISGETKALVTAYENNNFHYQQLSMSLDKDDILYRLLKLQKKANI